MEQHAVPQDITGFKFKLVGDMTLVQFGELAFGLVIAWILLASPIYPVLKYPLGVFFALLGAGLAFVPIEERPMHVWIFNFFRAIYRPTYFIWKRNNGAGLQMPPGVTATPTTIPDYTPVASTASLTPPLKEGGVDSLTENQAVIPTNNIPSTLTVPVATEASIAPITIPLSQNVPIAPLSVAELMRVREQKEQQVAQPIGIGQSPIEPQTVSTETTAQKPMTIEGLVKRREEMSSVRDQKASSDLVMAEKKVNDLTEQNKQLLMQIDEIKNKLYQNPGQDISALNKDLDGLMEKKTKLAGEIASVRDDLNGARVAPLTNSFYQEPVNVKRVEKVVPKVSQKQAIVSLTTVPNVVNGLVLDENGKPLDAAILIVKDQNNNSIRALRTNRVGQFIASTPLSDGTYFIEVEKANYVFDAWQITLSGQVLEPLEIRAKTSTQGAQVN